MHNSMFGKKIPHPRSTNFEDNDKALSTSSPKRVKRHADHERNATSSTAPVKFSPSKRIKRPEIPDSEDEDEEGGVPLKSSQSDLETALPALNTDQEAIDAYEAYKAGEDTLQTRLKDNSWQRGRSSIYVDAFNLALETVLEDEGHLFDAAEHALFQEWKRLSYEAQYLYVRLFLRKTSAWHRMNKLGYHSDIADIDAAISELQELRSLPDPSSEVQVNPGENEPQDGTYLDSTFHFADCSSTNISTLEEASNLLLLDELKVLAKEAKVQGKNKSELLRALRRTSGKQTGIAFNRSETEESVASEHTEADDDARSDGTSTPSRGTNRDAHYTSKILAQTGKLIRLSLPPLRLFERVHLVFYRSTEWTEKSLTTLILAKISRKNFATYLVSRSATIFESRELLLEFNAALRTQFRVDSILEFNGTPGRIGLEEVKSIFEEVYPRWQGLVRKEQKKENSIYASGEGAYLRRFSPAWVYTRIVHKGLHPLGRYKEHLREHGILCELLTQRLFHAARRGAWYQRKALLEEHYMWALQESENRSEEAQKKHWKRVALRTCEEGLQDPECHIIYHYDLQKRVAKVERQLKIPKREQHDFGHNILSKPIERTVEGIQIVREPTPAPESHLLRCNSSNGALNGSKSESPGPTFPPTGPLLGKRSTKTTWLDELDTQEQVSVESMCLSYYRSHSGGCWKGYHVEGGLLRTLFGLLFTDIIFTYVPNVFQTAFQTCPLDLHTDAFYPARLSEINRRIVEVGNGEAEKIIRDIWKANFETRTCIVGVRWDEFELEDLCEVVRCFGGERLGVVLRVMAQEYASRGGGVPDLFLWRTKTDVESRGDKWEGPLDAEGEVMFSEVKSENDRLSDTQRLWIHVLLGAGIKTELCHAVAKETVSSR